MRGRRLCSAMALRRKGEVPVSYYTAFAPPTVSAEHVAYGSAALRSEDSSRVQANPMRGRTRVRTLHGALRSKE